MEALKLIKEMENYAVKYSKQNIPYIYIEYYKPEEAKKAVEELNNENNLDNRQKLGDENCEINFYFKNGLNKLNPIIPKGNNITDMNASKIIPNNSNNVNIFKGFNPSIIYQIIILIKLILIK